MSGTLAAWGGTLVPNTQAVTVFTATDHAVYTGLAMANNGTQNELFAADNANGRIGVFGPTFAPITPPTGAFTDPALAATFLPYNIQSVSFGGVTRLVVTYRGTAGAGAVDIYNTDGSLFQHFSTDSHLSQPWGVALAPSTFGDFGGDLLIGNKSNGQINAFNPTTGAFVGTLMNPSNQEIRIPGLSALAFRAAGSGFDTNTLFFNAGATPLGGDIFDNGVFGSITLAPEPPSAVLLCLGMTLLGGVYHWRSCRQQKKIAH